MNRLFTASLLFNARGRKRDGSEREARGEGGEEPPTLSSLPFCADVQFSRDSIRAFSDRIKIRENGGL